MTGLIVPLVAGAALALGIPSGFGSILDSDTVAQFQRGFSRPAIQLGGIFFGAVGMLLLGFWDDRVKLQPGIKFLGQFLVATIVAASGVRITLFIPNLLFHYLITVLWIVMLVNAFDFMDNMNGLCGGLGIIGAGWLGLIAAGRGQFDVAAIAFLSAGALLGFLPFNFPRATAFLGDAGSHLTGYLLAVLGILPHYYTRKHPHPLAVLTPLLVLAVPLGDLLWVVLLRWKNGRPFYIGDTSHLSHRLVRRGFTPAGAVVLIWLLAAAAGALAFLLQ